MRHCGNWNVWTIRAILVLRLRSLLDHIPYSLFISRSNIPQKRLGKKFVFSLLEVSLASCTLLTSESKYPLFYFPKCPFICKIHDTSFPV